VGNSGSFKKGPDPRRHIFTKEDRSRGGLTSWWRTMIIVRASMGLDLVLPPDHVSPTKVSRIVEEARTRSRRESVRRQRKERS